MRHSRMAALGVAVSGLALLCGPATGQPLVNPPVVSSLIPQAPRLTSIAGAPEGCSGPTIFAAGGAYNGSADLFAGPTGLVLFGSQLQDISSISIVLANGARLTPTSQAACTAGGVSGLRVTFNLPLGTAETSRARLEIRAPQPQPLVKAPTTQPTCTDRITGQPTACPQLPKPAPTILTIADIQLTLFPRPEPNSQVRPEIHRLASGPTCMGRVTFPGRNLAQTRPTPDSSAAAAGLSLTVVSQSATGVLVDATKRCPAGSAPVLSSVSAAVPLRRGSDAGVKLVETCDTCSDVPVARGRFGGWGLLAG